MECQTNAWILALSLLIDGFKPPYKTSRAVAIRCKFISRACKIKPVQT